MNDSYSIKASATIAILSIIPSSTQLLIRDVIFILKLFQLKAECYNSVPRKGLHFIVKASLVSVAFHAADNYPLLPVELLVLRCSQTH